MTGAAPKNILILNAGLFPDQETMERTVRAIQSTSNISTVDIVPEQMDETAWDKMLGQIISADMLIAL
jgi:hypothetical protein